MITCFVNEILGEWDGGFDVWSLGIELDIFALPHDIFYVEFTCGVVFNDDSFFATHIWLLLSDKI